MKYLSLIAVLFAMTVSVFAVTPAAAQCSRNGEDVTCSGSDNDVYYENTNEDRNVHVEEGAQVNDQIHIGDQGGAPVVDIDNDGTITTTGNNDDGIEVDNDNGGFTHVQNNGTIDASDDGVDIDATGTGDNVAVVINAGDITAGDQGIDITADNTGARSAVSNSGTIDAQNEGIHIENENDDQSAPSVIANDGSVTGSVGINVENGGDATLFNAGEITGRDGTAVQFGEGDDSATFHEGSEVNGLIDGGAGTDDINFEFGRLQCGDDTPSANGNGSSGSINFHGSTHNWVNFEQVGVNYTGGGRCGGGGGRFIQDDRINFLDLHAPAALYCGEERALAVYNIDPSNGNGLFNILILGQGLDEDTDETLVSGGVTVDPLGNGEVLVTAIAFDGKPYSFQYNAVDRCS